MEDEYHHMDQIQPGLWVGDLHSAKDVNTLRANNIQSILTAMRGRFSLPDVCPNSSPHANLHINPRAIVDLHPTPGPLGRCGGS